MAGSVSNTDIAKLREAAAPDGEPLLTEERTVQSTRGSCHCNLTKEGRDILGLTSGTEVFVHVYPNRVVIEKIERGDSE